MPNNILSVTHGVETGAGVGSAPSSGQLADPIRVLEMYRENTAHIVSSDKHRIKLSNNLTFYKGKHTTVFAHSDFPSLIFKVMKKKSALKRLEDTRKALDIVSHGALSTCFIPQVQLVEIPSERSDSSEEMILITEKAPGFTSVERCKETAEQEFSQFSSDPALKQTWKNRIQETAKLACRLGFFDVSWSNILLTHDKFSFIDLEELTSESDPEEINSLKTGLLRLISMAPAFEKDVLQIAREEKGIVFSEEELTRAREEGEKELDLLRTVREFHAAHPVDGISTPINPPSDATEVEKRIIKECNEALVKNLSRPHSDTPFTGIRTLSWEPFMPNLSDLLSLLDDASKLKLKRQPVLPTTLKQTTLPVAPLPKPSLGSRIWTSIQGCFLGTEALSSHPATEFSKTAITSTQALPPESSKTTSVATHLPLAPAATSFDNTQIEEGLQSLKEKGTLAAFKQSGTGSGVRYDIYF